ncbi:MAG TPA: hypothetical protein VMD58_00870 [Acidobacteriaceae bacterium]|nr:hypothetical protein [Acidobacteriaceae bacterium]
MKFARLFVLVMTAAGVLSSGSLLAQVQIVKQNSGVTVKTATDTLCLNLKIRLFGTPPLPPSIPARSAAEQTSVEP